MGNFNYVDMPDSGHCMFTYPKKEAVLKVNIGLESSITIDSSGKTLSKKTIKQILTANVKLNNFLYEQSVIYDRDGKVEDEFILTLRLIYDFIKSRVNRPIQDNRFKAVCMDLTVFNMGNTNVETRTNTHHIDLTDMLFNNEPLIDTTKLIKGKLDKALKNISDRQQ